MQSIPDMAANVGNPGGVGGSDQQQQQPDLQGAVQELLALARANSAQIEALVNG